MPLTVLSVSYPLAAVSRDSTGGAEQILAALDRALVAAGHRSIVVAPRGSTVAGELAAIPAETGMLDDAARHRAQNATREVVRVVRSATPIDIIHLHGIDFPAYLPDPGMPVLGTLHLPVAWYPPDILSLTRPDTWLHCVSPMQDAGCPRAPNLLPPIENGIPVAALTARHAKRRFALVLGRICPEKGIHLAIAAAERAAMPLLIAGEIYPYAEHRRYFDEAIRPHLGPACRFLGPVGFARKRRLLTAARCLLVPALAAETSSLVAREAAACGTPVVAFPSGALADTVEDERTGLLVSDVPAMAAAIGRVSSINPAICRDVAKRRFSETAMIEAYFALYAHLVH